MKRRRICTGSRSVAPTPRLIVDECGTATSEGGVDEPVEIPLIRPSRHTWSILPRGRARQSRRSLPPESAVPAAGVGGPPVIRQRPSSMITMVRFFGCWAAMVTRQPSCISSEPSPSERDDVTLRLRHTECDRDRKVHAAQHVEVLRAMAGRPQIEIGVADAADHGFFVLEPRKHGLAALSAQNG
jgi:hypothetical protein